MFITSCINAQRFLSNNVCELNSTMYPPMCQMVQSMNISTYIPCRYPAPTGCEYRRFKYQDFIMPNISDNVVEYPSAPEKFNVIVNRVKRIGSSCEYGLNISWSISQDKSQYLTGYILDYSYYIYENNTLKRRHLIREFSLNSTTINQSNIHNFVYDCGVVLAKYSSNIRAELYSLPRSIDNHIVAYIYQEQLGYMDNSTLPWKASMVVIASDQNAAIDVWFYQAENKFNFTKYLVSLRIKQTFIVNETYIQPLELEEARLHIRFDNLSSNIYEVQILPYPYNISTTIDNIRIHTQLIQSISSGNQSYNHNNSSIINPIVETLSTYNSFLPININININIFNGSNSIIDYLQRSHINKLNGSK